MYCKSCGQKIPDDSIFCSNCGVNVKRQKSNTPSDSNANPDIFEKWKTWDEKRKILSVITGCCIGLIILVGVIGLLTPDENPDTVSTYYSSDNSNVLDNLENQSTESAGVSDTPSETYSNYTSYDDSSSSKKYSSDTSASGGSYVGNANTKKFHTSHCSQGGRIKSSNKVYFSSRDEAVSSGYTPCKVCNP